MTTEQTMTTEQEALIERLTSDVERLEDAMRQIQATTSDKAVQSITDEALCFITEQEGET